MTSWIDAVILTERTDKIHCFQPQIIRKNPYLFYTFAPKRKQQTWNYSIK